MKVYRYVGPKRITDRIHPDAAGVPVRSPEDVRAWVRATSQALSAGCMIATYIVDAIGVVLIADRRPEHVVCATGRPVRSAGEITFAVARAVEVVAVSNQSTGYCLRPESWPAVAAALASAELEPPAGFALACDFRRCVGRNSLTLIKCGVCGAELPAAYNCQAPGTSPSGGD